MSIDPTYLKIANLKGPQGEDGLEGAPGPATAFRIGEVRQVPAGTPAGARVRGTAPDLVLDLDLPAGMPGTTAIPADAAVAAYAATPGSETSKVVPTVFTSTGSTESQSARLNALLATAVQSGAQNVFVLVGTFYIGAAIVLRSNTTLDLTRATLVAHSSLVGNLIQNTSVNPARIGTANDASVEMAGTVITSTSALFTAADIGRQVGVQSATNQGLSAYGTITAVAGNTATITGTVIRAETAGKVWVFPPRDKNIFIVGNGSGVVDRGSVVGNIQWNQHSIRLRRIDNVGVSGLNLRSKVGKYMVSFGDVTDYFSNDCWFDCKSDGIHVQGPAYRGYSQNLRGQTGDDALAFTCVDYESYNDVFGDIIGHSSRGLFPNGSLAALKILAGTATKLRAISVDGISGTTTIRPVAICGDGTGVSDIADVEISNVDADVPTNAGQSAVLLFSVPGHPLHADRITLRNIRSTRPSTTTGGVVSINDGGLGTTVGTIDISGVSGSAIASATSLVTVNAPVKTLRVRRSEIVSGTGAAHGVRVNAGNSVDDLLIEDVNVSTELQTATALYIGSAATVKRVTMRGVTAAGGMIYSETSNAMALSLTTCTHRATIASGNAFLTISGPTTATLSSCVSDAPASSVPPFRFGTAAASLEVAGALTQAHAIYGVVRASGATGAFTTRGLGIPSRLDHVTKAPGAMVDNRLASVPTGIGPCVSDGTMWRNIATGAVAAPPTIASASPATSPGAQTVNFTGTGFAIGATTVTVNGAVAPTSGVTSTTNTGITFPAGPAGVVVIQITTPWGVSAPFNYTRTAS